MNLRFVEAFYWVAELKSVTRAAEKLFLTQSAMSARIAALEQELGVALLDRRDKQFRLTAPGVRFLAYAVKLLDLQRQARSEMAPGKLMPATLRLGVIESVLHSWLIPLVETLRADHQGLELELTVETTPMLLDQIQRGALDLAFAALPSSAEGLRSKAFPAMDMVFVGHPQLHRAQAVQPGRRGGHGHPHLPARLSAACGFGGPVPAGRAAAAAPASGLVDLRDDAAGGERVRDRDPAAGGGAAFRRTRCVARVALPGTACAATGLCRSSARSGNLADSGGAQDRCSGRVGAWSVRRAAHDEAQASGETRCPRWSIEKIDDLREIFSV